ncbi:MAG: hypothetical protein KDD35_01505 [Bdellovibrionales bacterium]|nr:hypothetical protein [Bdellovibrionales bacterium]
MRQANTKDKTRLDRLREDVTYALGDKSRSQIIVETCGLPKEVQSSAEQIFDQLLKSEPYGKSKSNPDSEQRDTTEIFKLAKNIEEKWHDHKASTCFLQRALAMASPEEAARIEELSSPAIRGALEPAINMNGHHVGIDKIGHFFSQGYEYFREAYIYDEEKNAIVPIKNGVQKALALGKSQEEGGFGWTTTGVKSYGDLSANYSGMLFWHRLTQGNQSLYVCQNGKFVLRNPNRTFDFADYVDDAWDEAINCSEFAMASMTAKINENLHKANMDCPIDTEKCTSLKNKYGNEIYKEIVSPICQKAVRASPESKLGEKSGIPTGKKEGIQ